MSTSRLSKYDCELGVLPNFSNLNHNEYSLLLTLVYCVFFKKPFRGLCFRHVHAWSRSHVQLLVTPQSVAHQAPVPMGFPMQENWSALLLPSSGDLTDPRIEPASPALAGRVFAIEPPGKPLFQLPLP